MTPCESSLRPVTPRRSWTLFGVVLALLAGSLVSWVGFDQRAISWLLHSQIDPDANFWVKAFTLLGKAWFQIWLLLIWFVFSHRRREVLAGLLALVILGVSVVPLKVAVGRVRPYSIVKAQEAGRPEQDTRNHLSFPSGDTAAAFAITAAIGPGVGWPLRVLLLGSSLGIGCLRVTAMAHYPSDVLAGAAMGLLAGWLAIRMIDRWGHADRAVPVEGWLVWGGMIGLPVSVGVSEGADELLVFLKTYGVLALCTLLVAGLGDLWRRTGPKVVLAFLARTRHIAVSAAVMGVIVENVVNGEKPHELLPLNEPISPWAALGLALVVTGALTRLRSQKRVDGSGKSSSRLDAFNPYWRLVGPFLVVCGLLTQLQDRMNWLVVMPVFILFYGAAMAARDQFRPVRPAEPHGGGLMCLPVPSLSLHFPTLSRLRDLRCPRLLAGAGPVWTSVVLVCLPLVLELLVEDFICETLLGMR